MEALTLLFTFAVICLLIWCLWALIRPPIRHQQSHTTAFKRDCDGPHLDRPSGPPRSDYQNDVRERSAASPTVVDKPIPVSSRTTRHSPPPPPPPLTIATSSPTLQDWDKVDDFSDFGPQDPPSSLRETLDNDDGLEVQVEYIQNDGVQELLWLRIYSFNRREGAPHSLNARQDGQRFARIYPLERVARLIVPETPPLSIESYPQICDWLLAFVSEKVGPLPTPATVARTQVPASPSGQGEDVKGFPVVLPEQTRTDSPGPLPLEALLPDGAQGFAVFDLETTGLSRSSKIIEIALIKFDATGRITEEWETLVNPGVSILNQDIHGLTDHHVVGAPQFSEIAGLLAAKLHGHVLVAHNLHSYDLPILRSHFDEVVGIQLKLGDGIDTIKGSARKGLQDLCAQVGISHDGDKPHEAMVDTRVLASAFRKGLCNIVSASSFVEVVSNDLLSAPVRTRTRAMVASIRPQAGWHPLELKLAVGQVFMSTGPKTSKANTPIRKGRNYLVGLGLRYLDKPSFPKKELPDFLLTTDLGLDNRKMREVRQLDVPLVLLAEISSAQIGSILRAWVWRSDS